MSDSMENLKNNVDFAQALKTPQFSAFFKANVVPILKKAESVRKGYLFTYYFVIALAVVISACIYIFHRSFGFWAVVAMSVVITFTVLNYLKIVYSLNVKKMVLPKMLSFWGNFVFDSASILQMIWKWFLELIRDYTDLQFYVNKSLRMRNRLDKYSYSIGTENKSDINVERIKYGYDDFSGDADAQYAKSLLLFPKFNRCDSFDNFKGVYKDLKIAIRSLHIKNVEYAKSTIKLGPIQLRGAISHNVFDGVLVTSSINKEFKGRVVIRKEKGLMNKLEGISLPPRVVLEDPVFESIFEVYADDQIEARYLLTTAFMERLVSVVGSNNQFDVVCSFENGVMNLGLQKKKKDKWFEFDLFKPADVLRSYQKIFLDLDKIFTVIDVLKLEQKIGM